MIEKKSRNPILILWNLLDHDEKHVQIYIFIIRYGLLCIEFYANQNKEEA